MAPSSSKRTIRVRGITPETSISQLQAAIELAGSTASRRSRLNPFASSSAVTPDRPIYSLAQQNALMTSTISFASADDKTKAFKKLASDYVSWEIDDHFAGLTILCAPDNKDIE